MRATCEGCGATYEGEHPGPIEDMETHVRNFHSEEDSGGEIVGVGPFYYVGEEGFEAWGFAFPSGYTVLEWVRESVPDDEETLTHHHQSVYHSVEDFRMVCTGRVDWGISPEQFGNQQTASE